MIHPHTELGFINGHIGYGVFATQDIPLGTIVYIKDALEVVLPMTHQLLQDRHYQPIIEKYSYTEPNGDRVLSWDLAKYVNHSCNSNTLSTGYGFEIAVRDIKQGEEITDDYGMLNVERSMDCHCGSHRCRGKITTEDFYTNNQDWDSKVINALVELFQVDQPLFPLLEDTTRLELFHYMASGSGYRGVGQLAMEYLDKVAAD